MEFKYVLYEQFDEIVKVTVNRPEVMNAISRRVYAELDEAFARAEEDDGVKVIVLAGAGDHFGAGHDLGSAAMQAEQKENPRDRSALNRIKDLDRGVYWRLHNRWRNIGKATIAMVQGYCIMGSWMLAATCDLIVASEDAKFTDRSVRWGNAHHEYPTAIIDFGPRKAKELLWTGDFIDAQEAWRLGLVNRVVPREKLEDATMWLARRVALNDLFALKLSKMSINQSADIMGQSMAVQAAGNFWLLSGLQGSAADDSSRVAWSKAQNKRFDDMEKEQGNPFRE